MILKDDSYIWKRLFNEFVSQREYIFWPRFIESLDPNIESVYMNFGNDYTQINFKSEHSETWFILRWS